MSDSSTHQEPAVQQPEKQCVVCAESIKVAAKKCIRCGAYQDLRRYSDYIQPWVPWLVAVVTTILLISTNVSQFVHVPDSNLELSSPHVFNDEARFIVANAGDRPGVVEQVSVSLSLKDASGRLYSFQSEHTIPPEQTDIIKPGEQRSYQFLLTDRLIGVEFESDVPGFLKMLRQTKEQMFERTWTCRFSIAVRNFRSHRKHIDNPISCDDLSIYVNNYLVRMERERKGLQESKGAQP